MARPVGAYHGQMCRNCDNVICRNTTLGLCANCDAKHARGELIIRREPDKFIPAKDVHIALLKWLGFTDNEIIEL